MQYNTIQDNREQQRKETKTISMTSERRTSAASAAAADAMESRFEVLEEETHFPASHPQSAAAKQAQEQAAAGAEEDAQAAEEDESLEAKLEKLLLNDGDDKSVKSASRAKELGNECVRSCYYVCACVCELRLWHSNLTDQSIPRHAVCCNGSTESLRRASTWTRSTATRQRSSSVPQSRTTRTTGCVT